MSTLTIDEKLLMIQKMRAHAKENQNSIYMQEQLPLYVKPSEQYLTEASEKSEGEHMFSSLRLRLVICALVFSAFVGLYKLKIPIQGHQVTEVSCLLEENKLPENAQSSLEAASERVLKQVKSLR